MHRSIAAAALRAVPALAAASALLLASSAVHAQDEGGSRPAAAPAPAAAALTGHWPQFRGPDASGRATPDVAAPTSWDVASGENVRWSMPVPGLSHSSPVVWDTRIFLTTAVRVGTPDEELKVGLYGSVASVEDDTPHRFQVLCHDLCDGALLWARTVFEGVPDCKRHPKGSHAASTPATDGEYVVAMFGSEGLHCFRIDGQRVWSKDLGRMDSGFFSMKDAQWGFSASPVLRDGIVYMQCDVQDDAHSFVAAFDVETGEQLWRTPRKDVPTWSTPAVWTPSEGEDGRSQLVLNGWHHIGGYDLATGEELWWFEGGGDIPVPTPVLLDDLAFITNAHGRARPIYAVDLSDASGELDGSQAGPGIAWSEPRRGGNYMQTPIVVDGLLFLCLDNGVVSCYDARTGERHFGPERIGDGTQGFTASPVAAGGVLYFTSELGEVVMVRAAPEFEHLGMVELGETCMASPAVVSGGHLLFRTRSKLVLVGPGAGW